MADARSQVIRDGVWEWFNGTVYNRLQQPGGAIIRGDSGRVEWDIEWERPDR